MPRNRPPGWVPKYKLHKSSGHGFVTLDGKNTFLGRHGSPASTAEYERLIAEWLTRNRRAEPATGEAAGAISVSELIAAYRAHVEQTYPAATVAVIKAALRPLRALYGHTLVRDFSPVSMKALQRTMANAKDEDAEHPRLCRNTANGYAAKIRQFFKWGVGEGLVPPTVWHGLLAVPGLRRGRSPARDTEPVGPVADAVVDATLPHLPPVVTDMVRLQRLTGMRPGEVCAMSPAELETGGNVWFYRPRKHKTAHHGKDRVVPIGPKAQDVLRPYLRRELSCAMFRPVESEEIRKEIMRKNRATPLTPSQRARAERAAQNPRRRQPGERYTAAGYRRAVARAAERAGVAIWAPNQLRHSKATEVRRDFGLDAAGAMLGHAKLETTQVYAQRNLELAAKVALQTG